MLAITGIVLYFWYRPAGAPGSSTGPIDAVADALRVLHRLVALASVPTAVAVAVLLVLPRSANRTPVAGCSGLAPWVGPAAGIGVVVATLAGVFTGGLLAWDQVALSTVTVGSNLRGYQFLHDGSAHFVLFGASAVGTGELARTLVLHTTVLAAATAILLGVAHVVAASRSPAGAGRRFRRPPGEPVAS